MNVDDIISRIRRGEDSVTQFKRQAIGVAKLADEMVAFANAEGGVILFGVDDDGTVVGLNAEQKALINREFGNAASDGVRPAIYPRTEFHEIKGKLILAVIVPEGVSKPYANNSGVSCARNATIASFASKELPYRGLGTGVKRAVEAIPDIQFESDRDANWLKAIVKRESKSGNADSKENGTDPQKKGWFAASVRRRAAGG